MKKANGEGTIRKRNDGLFEVRLMVRDTHGARKQISKYGTSIKDAQQKLNKLKAQVDAGVVQPVDISRLTVGEYLESWLLELRVRPKTVDHYRWAVDTHIVAAGGLGGVKLTRLNADQVQGFLDGKAASHLSTRSVQILRNVLRAALNKAMAGDQPLLHRNVATKVHIAPVKTREVDPYDPAEADAFLTSLEGYRHEAIYRVAITCGVRRGEALGLKWQDIKHSGVDENGHPDLLHATEATLNVWRSLSDRRRNGVWDFGDTKTAASARTVPVPASTLRVLQDHKRAQLALRLRQGRIWISDDHPDAGCVFTAESGGPLNARNVLRELTNFQASKGLRKQAVHELRHGTASLLQASGAPMEEIQKILGHKDLRLTANLYAHMYDEGKRKAMARLDDMLTKGAERQASG